MTQVERRATFFIALIMALRILGLFMLLPLFTLYAQGLKGATPQLLGISLGIYGLTQGMLQMPFGSFSDYYGRKPLIILGLTLFAIGSLIVAYSSTIWGMLVGRTLQGTGAVGSTLLALLADSTRIEQRSKAMAILGITLGASFATALFLGPFLAVWLSIPQIFTCCALFATLGIALLHWCVPAANLPIVKERYPKKTISLLWHPALYKLNIGILLLHAILTASFIAIPLYLQTHLALPLTKQWRVYLPVLLLSLGCLFPLLRVTDKNLSSINWAIILLGSALLSLAIGRTSLSLSGLYLTLFFIAFNLLEARLPALVSILAPPEQKGAALGIYSSCQFLGIFIGGSLGGWTLAHFQTSGVFKLGVLLSAIWLLINARVFRVNQRYCQKVV